MLDVVSDGRLELTLAAGYVAGRVRDVRRPLRRAGKRCSRRRRPPSWRPSPVSPSLPGPDRPGHPGTGPAPPSLRGVRQVPAPRRAARLGDAYLPPVPDQSLADAYGAECRRLGKGDGILLWPDGPMWVFVTEDPERSWAQIGPHAVHETNGYGAWSADDPGANPWREVTSVDEVRRAGLYAVVTPDECLALARSPRPPVRAQDQAPGGRPRSGHRLAVTGALRGQGAQLPLRSLGGISAGRARPRPPAPRGNGCPTTTSGAAWPGGSRAGCRTRR